MLVKPRPAEDVFPTPPLEHPSTASFRIKGRMSPAPAKLMGLERAASTPPEVTHPGKMSLSSQNTKDELSGATKLKYSWSRRQQVQKKKSQYFGEAFAYREPTNPARDRVLREAIIVAEVKLNFHVSQPHLGVDDTPTELFAA